MLFSAMPSTSCQASQNINQSSKQFTKELVKEKNHHMEPILDGLLWLWLKDSDDLMFFINCSLFKYFFLNITKVKLFYSMIVNFYLNLSLYLKDISFSFLEKIKKYVRIYLIWIK